MMMGGSDTASPTESAARSAADPLSAWRDWIPPRPDTPALADVNADGSYDVANIGALLDSLWNWAGWTFFLPGNVAANFLMADSGLGSTAVFLGVTLESYYWGLSGIISAAFWFSIILMMKGVLAGLLHRGP